MTTGTRGATLLPVAQPRTDDRIAVKVRLFPEHHAAIAAAAKANHRVVSAEVAHRIQQSLEAEALQDASATVPLWPSRATG